MNASARNAPIPAGPTASADENAVAGDRASILPACLAALAEAGVIFLPVQEVIRELTFASRGPLLSAPVFYLLFVGGVGLATAFRRSARSATVAAAAGIALGVLQAWVWGSSNPFAAAGVVILALAATLRVVTLASRDWRVPIASSIAFGAVGLLFEVSVSGGAPEPWSSLIGLVAALFFVASLASRAASVRIAEAGRARAALGLEVLEPSTVAGLALRGLSLVTIALALVSIGSGHGGLLRGIGLAALAAVGLVLSAVAWVLSPLVVVVAWIANLLNIDLVGLIRRAVVRIRLPAAANRHLTGNASALERVLEIAALLAVVGLFVWLIRRRRRHLLREISRRAASDEQVRGLVASDMQERSRRVFGIRRELPAVTVRRWYAEALLALERRDLNKRDHLTPAEFVPSVVAAFPSVRVSFEDLTHAYEDVRYGGREITHARLARLAERRPILMETLHNGVRADIAASESESESESESREPPGPWTTP